VLGSVNKLLVFLQFILQRATLDVGAQLLLHFRTSPNRSMIGNHVQLKASILLVPSACQGSESYALR
jgi:hypothetical protein